MEKITKEQAIVLSGFTGILMCHFSELHQDVEKRMKHPVFTHQFGDEEFSEKVKQLYRDDFVALLPDA